MKGFYIKEDHFIKALTVLVVGLAIFILLVINKPEWFESWKSDCETKECTCLGTPSDRNCDGVGDGNQ